MKSIAEINEKIRRGEAVIVRADEMPEIVSKKGPEKAAEKVDVVTTGTFGAMCSSGAFLNLGHSDPPIKIQKAWLNDVEAYAGLAAVDLYVGATELSTEKGMDYGGGHVIEDLVAGRSVDVKAKSYGTDCYPAKYLETTITLDDVNQAMLFNPRNNYQRYNAAANTSERTLYTYMGTLLPNMRNINYAGTGEISPLNNDPEYLTIGTGTRIFLGGAQGYVISEGTQHSPKTGFGTIAVSGDLKEMSAKYLRGVSMKQYGTSLLVGIGVPIPVLNPKIAKCTAIQNPDIRTNILDYSVPRRTRPVLKNVSYDELISGKVSIGDKTVKTASMSSFRISYEIMEKMREWMEAKEFYLTEPVRRLPRDTVFNPMRQKKKSTTVGKLMSKPVITVNVKSKLNAVSLVLVENNIDQVPVIDDDGRLVGIVTAWDITKATAENRRKLSEVMTSNVIMSKEGEFIDEVSRRLEKHKINSTPIVDDERRVIGIITLSDINKAYRGLNK
ncbi:MAG: homocysteine biosynthesis protein [Candidatus Altiarchaeota archaeon]